MRPHVRLRALLAAALLLGLAGPHAARARGFADSGTRGQDRRVLDCGGCPGPMACRRVVAVGVFDASGPTVITFERDRGLRDLASEGATRLYSAGKHYVRGLGQAVVLLLQTAGTLAG